MGRYAVTLVFEVGDGKMPRGADVLDRMRLGDKAVHRFSYCDGRSLTVIVDWSADSAAHARMESALAIRLVWAQLTGSDPGEPLSSRARPLNPPERVAAGVMRRATAFAAHPGRFRRLGPPPEWLSGPEFFDPPDDDGGLAGVREPRRPKPTPPPLARTLDEPITFLG